MSTLLQQKQGVLAACATAPKGDTAKNPAPERVGPLYFLTSDGLNTLPSPATITTLCLDANVLSRLNSAKTDDYVKLRSWLALNKRHPGHSAMTSVALEYVISNDKSRIARVPVVLRELSAPVLGHKDWRLRVDGDGTVAGVICDLASNVLVSCAEIAWVRRHRPQNKDSKPGALKVIQHFLEWRRREFPDVSQTISTMLCLATIAGNDVAASALKALKRDPEHIRNGAFDAVHLDHFAQACRPDRGWTFGSSLSVFVTGDKGLAKALTSFESGWVGDKGVALMKMDLPWLGAKIAEQVRRDFVGWRETAEHQALSVDVRALMQVLRLCGYVPRKVQVLFCRTQEYRRRLKTLNRKTKVGPRRLQPRQGLLRPNIPFELAVQQGVSVLSEAMEQRIRLWASRTPVPGESGNRGSASTPEVRMTEIAEQCAQAFGWRQVRPLGVPSGQTSLA